MKTLITSLILTFYPLICILRRICGVTFEDPTMVSQTIFIDNINHPLNKWQVGPPAKIIFDSAYTPSNVIITDSVNTIPPSDTSVFILKVYNPFGFPAPTYVVSTLSFFYKLHKDSTDLALVEVAADTGQHWVNMLTQDTTYNIVWFGNKPNFQDTSTSWKEFKSNFSQWFSAPYSSGFYPYYADADTFRFRFTFISSSTSSNKEGCMIDDIHFNFTIPEGIAESMFSPKFVNFYPNPTKNFIFLERLSQTSEDEYVLIYSIDGRELFREKVNGKKEIKFELNPGVYLLRYNASQIATTQRIIIE